MSAPIHFDAPLTLGAQIEVRAGHPELENQPLVIHGDRTVSYREFRDECVRTAHFLNRRAPAKGQGRVAMMLENQPELLSLYGACGYTGHTLFGVNAGLRGETLAGVLNQSEARLLVVDQRFEAEVERVRDRLETIAPENILVLRTDPGAPVNGNDYLAALAEEAAPGSSLDAPKADVTPETNLMVIYTSGTTGLPKGINNNHFKLMAIGMAMAGRLELDRSTRGYACMPLFHSNAMFLGFQPCFQVGGSLVLRERFSASQFVPDVLRHGVTYWNYVGEPVHYILGALEKQYGSEERILAEVAGHPDNRLAYAIGNGAAPPDIDRFIRWLGLEDMFELYGSTEAAISTFRRKTDPRSSVGVVEDDAVKILDEDGKECPPARTDGAGNVTNYAEAVGEICRVAPETGLFQGYFGNPDANAKKYRDGVYHSGDLGHMRIIEGKRYLYFDGRTDDWIRKDGENFSAAQVARLLMEHPDVTLAAAYGAPCAVSDEHVMAALKLQPGARFDPAGFFAWCEEQIGAGGMDRKWFPDYVRLVDEFEFTQTQKILVRHLKKDHFNRKRLPGAPLYFRQRGDTAFREFGLDDYAALEAEFAARERASLLDR